MRLIDADAFKKYCEDGLENMKSLFKTESGLELAIKTTESFLKDIDEQPTVEMAEDCVSREQAVYVASGYCAPQNIADELRKLPSVTPQHKRGKWIRVNGDNVCTLWKCDQCGCEIYSETEHDRKKFHAWCGMCGAKMEILEKQGCKVEESDANDDR